MTMTQQTQTELLKRIAFFMGTCMDPRYTNCSMDKLDTQEPEIDTRHYYNTKNQITMTTQRKKVGKSTSPNRLNRSTHYIGQPRSTGGNH
jgi:hypothetical protein